MGSERMVQGRRKRRENWRRRAWKRARWKGILYGFWIVFVLNVWELKKKERNREGLGKRNWNSMRWARERKKRLFGVRLRDRSGNDPAEEEKTESTWDGDERESEKGGFWKGKKGGFRGCFLNGAIQKKKKNEKRSLSAILGVFVIVAFLEETRWPQWMGRQIQIQKWTDSRVEIDRPVPLKKDLNCGGVEIHGV